MLDEGEQYLEAVKSTKGNGGEGELRSHWVLSSYVNAALFVPDAFCAGMVRSY